MQEFKEMAITPIHRNAFHNVMFEENGYTKEEMKLVRETLKNIRR
jgi:aspartate-semialdehyde dehydrogenase